MFQVDYCASKFVIVIVVIFMRTPMFQVDYCASKFACVGLDEALRVETLVHVIILPSQSSCS